MLKRISFGLPRRGETILVVCLVSPFRQWLPDADSVFLVEMNQFQIRSWLFLFFQQIFIEYSHIH